MDDNKNTHLFVKCNKDVILPSYGSEYAAGLDLHALNNGNILPYEQALISTGLYIEIPTGYYGRIAPRSGFSWKKYTDIGAGVIDSDYRGEVKIIVRNLSNTEILYEKGDAIAQLIITPYAKVNIIVIDNLEPTKRNTGGFGSTVK